VALKMKKLCKTEMKNVIGGFQGRRCLDAAACSVVTTGSGGNNTWYGNCGLINGRCKCDCGIGDYQTSDDTYACEA
jgi:hypothetical protein